jgi:RND family efflux transporter MFP subunit
LLTQATGSKLYFALPLALTLLLGCSRNSDPPPAVAHAASDAITIVATAKPGRERLSRTMSLAGEFRANRQVDLHAKVAGYLKTIAVDVGDRVREGAVVATLEVPEMDADLAQAAAQRSRAEAELLRGRAELQRSEASLTLERVSYDRLAAAAKAEKGLIAEQEIDAAMARRTASEAQVASAKAAITIAERQIEAAKAGEQRTHMLKDYTRISAPFAGVITRRYADPGAMIQAGTASQSQAMPVVRLAEIAKMRFVAVAPESAVPLIRTGHPVEVRAAALNRSFPAAVSRVNGNIQFSSRTMEVEIDVANSAGLLLPGMQGEAVLTLAQSQDAITVPVQAVINAGGNRYVWFVNGNEEVEERQIRTGIESAASFEVLEGLRGDEQLVVSNRGLLKPGLKVRSKPAEKR